MATAFAEQERTDRGLEETVEILTGGTRPADKVHDIVVEVMRERGFDLSDRTPKMVTTEELATCDVIATMGCSTLDLGEEGDTVDIRDWALDDPDGVEKAEAARIRDEIAANVSAFFDEIEATR